MAEIPEAMKRRGRPVKKRFPPDEELFRRFAPESLLDGQLSMDAIALPDMSVNRGSLDPPEWVLLSGPGEYECWGIAKFYVRDIPTPLTLHGTREFRFCPVHVPLANNYPHSEVRAYDGERHIRNSDELDPELHLRWRLRLRRGIRIHRQPTA